MTAKKGAKKATRKKAAAEVDDDQDDGLSIEFDPGSFTAPERRQIQERFGRQFEDLLNIVDAGVLRAKPVLRRDPANEEQVLTVLPAPPPEPFTDPAGELVFADQVLIAMLAVVASRDGSEVDPSTFDDWTVDDLLAAVGRGEPGKVRPRSTSSDS